MNKHATKYLNKTRNWVEQVVIGLNLCPFAAKPFFADQIRFVVTDAKTPMELMGAFLEELNLLVNSPDDELETTLLIHPELLNDFEEYLDFVAEAEDLLGVSGANDLVQLASFHPDYQFEGTTPHEVSNYTNRSPFPMIHLIRTESVEMARHTYPEIDQIPARNIQKMEEAGIDGMQKLLKQL